MFAEANHNIRDVNFQIKLGAKKYSVKTQKSIKIANVGGSNFRENNVSFDFIWKYEEKVPTKEKGRRKMLAMKVAAILLMSTILVQAQPFEKREASAAPFDSFAMMVQKYITENDFNALCNITFFTTYTCFYIWISCLL
jgi:hypothetical protein